MDQIAGKVIENEIVLCKEHIPSNFYFMKKINLFFERGLVKKAMYRYLGGLFLPVGRFCSSFDMF